MSDTEQDLNAKVIIGEETVSLADLAGVSLDDIAEQRGGGLPAGMYIFEVTSEHIPALVAIESNSKDKQSKVMKPAIKVPVSVLECIAVKDPSEIPDGLSSLVGRLHTETFFITHPAEKSLGFWKAFTKDIGGPTTGSMTSILQGCVGCRFQAPIQHKKDQNDEDKVYINIVRGKIKALPRVAASDVAQQVAE